MYVRVEVDQQRQFIEIDNIQQLTFRVFVKSVVDCFQVKNAPGKKVYVFDQLDTRIDNDALLKYLISSKSDNLILKVEFKENDLSGTTNHLTSKNIEEYLEKNGGKDVLKEYVELKTLNESKRHKLVNILVDMLIKLYGLYPKSYEKIMFAKAVIDLFPRFKVEETQHGTELFYNPSKNSGWFIPVLRARRKFAQKNKDEISDADENENNSDENEILTSVIYTDEDAKNDLEFLRTAELTQSNMDIITQKMKATLDYRKLVCNDANINLLERFPFFFTNSELILVDFTLRFGLQPNVFFYSWESCKKNVKTALQMHENTDDFETGFSEEIDNFLMLLKLLPERQKGRKTTRMRLNFNKMIDRLVAFSKFGEPLMNALKKDNKQPYIVMVGSSSSKPIRFYIVVDKEFITVDKNFSFAQTFDLLFKTHFAFNLSFDEHLMPLMKFVGYYFYKIQTENFTPTTHMIRVYNDIKSQE